ncbi:IS3 family transposase [Paenibacillus sp. DS2015]|uniref:IS3 family transposase n=1 Tax=Paenibacillus sp. DS2015 TaxID=3373917 RepID=UPI003D1A6E03
MSIDGNGRATDNPITKRYFRSFKYECTYFNEFETPRELRKEIDRYVQFFNEKRLISPLMMQNLTN